MKKRWMVLCSAVMSFLLFACPIAASADEAEVGLGEPVAYAEDGSGDGLVQAAYYEAKDVAKRSGNLEKRPLTKTEIANLYQDAKDSSMALTLETEPSLSAPYTTGKLAASSIAEGLKYVNMYRRIAGVLDMVEDPQWTTESQYAAVVLAALGEGVSHTPAKPTGMDDDFYMRGYNAASSSNLCAGNWGVGESITSYITDYGNSNRQSLGHRRWILNPQGTKIGFGGAKNPNSTYRNYFACKVFGDDYFSTLTQLFDWDFVSWPSSGNFPVELMGAGTDMAWSITLNSDKYVRGDVAKVTVKVTAPDGSVEEFSQADYHSNPKTWEKYFAVENSYYGLPNCLILGFGHDYEKFSVTGKYTVEVNGLESLLTGKAVSLKYDINVFRAADYAGRTPVTDAQYSSINDFVERMYTQTLGRASDEDGKLDWSMRLADGDESGAQVARGFVFSDEYLDKATSDDQYLDMLYTVFLNRAADAAGKEDWKNQLNNGLSREFIFRGFAESPEFGGICQSYGIERGGITLTEGRDLNAGATMFVYRLYDKALGRTPDLDGLNDWSGKIARGEVSAEYVATTGFFHSGEFQGKNYGNEDYVKILYRTFLGREYDDAGLVDWVGRLEGGASRDEVLRGFSDSKEFKGIMQEYGL